MRQKTLGKWLGRRAPLPTPASEAIELLARLAETQPDLRELATTTAALIEGMYAAELPRPQLALDQTHLATKLRGGVPLLRGEPIWLDGAALRRQFLTLCQVMQRHGNTAATGLARAVQNNSLAVADLATEVITGDPRAVAGRALDLDLDAGLAATLLRLTLFRSLEQLANDLRPRRADVSWRRGYCPTCGSWPLLGEYRGLEQARVLRCGLCADEWEIDRLVCPICTNRTHQDLLNLSVEGEEGKQRAVACERCHHYVKQISTLSALPAPRLLVADLASLHLDLIAHNRGYLPPQ